MSVSGRRLHMDVESYPNYYLVRFMDDLSGKRRSFEMTATDTSTFDRNELYRWLTGNQIITFNGLSYDIPMTVTSVIKDYNTYDMNRLSNMIIRENLQGWETFKKEGIEYPDWLDHIDIINVAPGMGSLKIYGGRMHTRKMQDLPYPPESLLNPREQKETRTYCGNDLMVTKELCDWLKKPLELRELLSKEYGVDMRSKSDAQIAEAVLKTEYERLVGRKAQRKTIVYRSFFYVAPSYVEFTTPALQEMLADIENERFRIDEKSGHVRMPAVISNMKIKIGETTYKLGIGGLHSQESCQTLRSSETHQLIDRDVASYYPNLILNMEMNPPAFGQHFSTVYRTILDRRMAAKRRASEIAKEIQELKNELRNLSPEG